MAIVSKFTSLFRKKRSPEKFRIYVTKGGRTSIDESYNRLKDNLLFFSEAGKKVFQVEASIPGEGKTTMVCNLGVSLAFNDKKVVIVDLDFRRPSVSKIFGVEEDIGIAEYIIGEKTVGEIIKTTEYGVDIITRGKEIHNSSLVFNSEKMGELIKDLREKYDIVLLDCPPVLLMSDYMHIVKYSDGVLFTVSANCVKKSAVRDSIRLLNKVNAEIIGTAMTFVSPDVVNYGYKKGKVFDK